MTRLLWAFAAISILLPPASSAQSAKSGQASVVQDITVDNRGFWTADAVKNFSAKKAAADDASALSKAFAGRWKWIEIGDFLGDGSRTAVLIAGAPSKRTQDGFVVTAMRLVQMKDDKWTELAGLTREDGLHSGTPSKGPSHPAGYELTLRVLRQGEEGVTVGLMAAPILATGLPSDDAAELDWSPETKKFSRLP